MTIPPDIEAQILRYYHVEKWRVGTIARQLRVHRDTVDRVLAQAGLPRIGPPPRPSQIDPFLPFIRQTLEKFPTLTASRLFAMVSERGYRGRPDHFRHLIARHRPKRKAEAFLRLRTLPGEQAQVDWAHFGHIEVPGGRAGTVARRPLMGFVMVLSHSRAIVLRFYLNARMDSFLHGHVAAFQAWGGVPKVLLYDNLKSAVLERQGDAIRFHPTLLDIAQHYRFDPRPVAVARGNEKGRVERAIRYVRDNFLPARDLTDIVTLQDQADAWCSGPAADRRCPENDAMTVREALVAETPFLLPLPETPYPVAERVPVVAGKTPYVRFDLNDYSIPHTHVRRSLTILADPDRVRVIDGVTELASHRRSYGKGETVEEPGHIEALVAEKRTARDHRATDRLVLAVPNAGDLLARAAQRGDNLGAITAALMRLLDSHGSAELQAAIAEALDSNVPHPNAVRLALERRREERNQAPPIPLSLPDHIRHRDASVRPHRLDTYDQLTEASDD